MAVLGWIVYVIMFAATWGGTFLLIYMPLRSPRKLLRQAAGVLAVFGCSILSVLFFRWALPEPWDLSPSSDPAWAESYVEILHATFSTTKGWLALAVSLAGAVASVMAIAAFYPAAKTEDDGGNPAR
ncbi:MAG: hypothetical protein D6806_12130 [Deltaproteobacteria bacterium]|nr:MAG: hypothetical protein D6806_12130 [Deltaproteobacteria bacterium]